MESGKPIEHEHDFDDTQMLTPEFTKAYTWVFPLLAGHELIGVIKLESLHIGMRELSGHLPTFFNYVASVLKNEIHGQTRLKQAYDQLSEANKELMLEIGERERAEEALRQASDELEVQVTERTEELRLAFKRLQHLLAEHERAEKALLESENRFRTIFDNTNDAIFVHDIETGAILSVNDTMCRMFGYSRDEAISIDVGTLSEGTPPYSQADSLGWIRRAVEGEPQIFDWHAKRKDGQLFWVEVSMRKARIASIDRLIVIVRDITERKLAEEALHRVNERLELTVTERTVQLSRAIASLQEENAVRMKMEEALREKEQYLQSIIDTSPECIKLLSRDGSLLMMNRAGLNMIDADSLEQVQGKVIYDLVMEEYRRQFIALTEEAFRGGSGNLEFEMKGLKDRRLWVETHTAPYRNEKNEVIALLGITRDITERKELDLAVRRSEQQFRAMFEEHSGVMLLLDPGTGHIIRANNAAAGFYGYPLQQLTSMSIFEINQLPAGEIRQAMQTCARCARNVFEFPHRLASGEVRIVEVHSSPVDLEGRTLLFSIINDITERKQAEAALRESRAHYKGLFSSMQEGFSLLEIIHDADGKPADYHIMEVNSAFERLFAMNQDMLIGRSLQEVFPQPEEYWLKNLANVALTGKPVILENYFDRHDCYFEEHAYKPAEGLIALLVTDLTERRNSRRRGKKDSALNPWEFSPAALPTTSTIFSPSSSATSHLPGCLLGKNTRLPCGLSHVKMPCPRQKILPGNFLLSPAAANR